jgi:SAM-dependent methyltransferase
MSEALAFAAPALLPILARLACPWCRAPIVREASGLRCTSCPAEFPEREGIVDLARRGTAETWGAGDSAASSQRYQEAYAELERAQDYNRAYEVRTLKRLSTLRERHLIANLLRPTGRVGSLLELPCGGGRLSPSFAPWTELLIQADTGWGQLLHANRRPALSVPRVLLAASGFHVPFRDGSLDGVACVRLSHHLPTSEERHRLLRELLRVARRYVLMTFFDHHSLKNRLRQRTRKPPKMTMTCDEVGGIAREHGAELVAAPMLSWVGSGHRYALIAKNK